MIYRRVSTPTKNVPNPIGPPVRRVEEAFMFPTCTECPSLDDISIRSISDSESQDQQQPEEQELENIGIDSRRSSDSDVRSYNSLFDLSDDSTEIRSKSVFTRYDSTYSISSFEDTFDYSDSDATSFTSTW